jgi:hypothetical protein
MPARINRYFLFQMASRKNSNSDQHNIRGTSGWRSGKYLRGGWKAAESWRLAVSSGIFRAGKSEIKAGFVVSASFKVNTFYQICW